VARFPHAGGAPLLLQCEEGAEPSIAAPHLRFGHEENGEKSKTRESALY
jgi:hypothetical protein